MFDTTIRGECGHMFHALTEYQPELGALVQCAVCNDTIELAHDNAIISETSQEEWDEYETWEASNG